MFCSHWERCDSVMASWRHLSPTRIVQTFKTGHRCGHRGNCLHPQCRYDTIQYKILSWGPKYTMHCSPRLEREITTNRGWLPTNWELFNIFLKTSRISTGPGWDIQTSRPPWPTMPPLQKWLAWYWNTNQSNSNIPDVPWLACCMLDCPVSWENLPPY